MRLALRLALTFGLLAAASSALVGVAVRYRLVTTETQRFQGEVRSVCDRIKEEIKRQADADRTLVTGFCKDGELVERVGIALETGDLRERPYSYAHLVDTEREAFGMDELIVGIERGEIVGASPSSLLNTPASQVDSLIKADPSGFVLRGGSLPALVTRCTKPNPRGKVVGMVAARHVDPMMTRLGKTHEVTVIPSWKTGKVPAPIGRAEKAVCLLEDGKGAKLPFEIAKSTTQLEATLAETDRTVGLLAIIAAVVAFLVAVVLARTISRPLAELAQQAGKVADDNAEPIQIRGSGEVRTLGVAFDKMVKDLAVTRRRLAAASRIAAWREVARRVAHEVKNPLAPIRAAVETLRRLRAREDPRFDEYFDEATRTVLDEVHRISNIVTEFTRFARLPPPRPVDMDVEEIAKRMVQTHLPAAGETKLAHVPQRPGRTIRADRDQVIQVLTNLVQNALDAVKETSGGSVTLTTDNDGRYAYFSVADNGPGVSPEFAGRLFEPYATTKTTGTGLGLAIAQRIAYEHNGELSYVGTSANGKGAVFRLVLPIEGPPAEPDPPPSSSTGDEA
jgi:two-component system nitrogen regulation sensor histidine kinase NtrY